MQETFALVDELLKKPLQYLHVSLWDFYKHARRGADISKTRMQLLHERIAGKVPLIGVGNLYTADDMIKAYQTGYADLLAVGKSILPGGSGGYGIAGSQRRAGQTIYVGISVERSDYVFVG